MAGNNGAQNGLISGINVTPLVDVTLVLLIIFIVTAKIAVSPAVPLDLPRAAQSEAVQTVFSVTIPLSGALRVNGSVIDGDAALVQLAEGAKRNDPETRAVIQADGGVPHRKVIHTLDLLKRAGIAKVAFGALPEEPEPEAP
jgi:biopolymer transport protein ExbD